MLWILCHFLCHLTNFEFMYRVVSTNILFVLESRENLHYEKILDRCDLNPRFSAWHRLDEQLCIYRSDYLGFLDAAFENIRKPTSNAYRFVDQLFYYWNIYRTRCRNHDLINQLISMRFIIFPTFSPKPKNVLYFPMINHGTFFDVHV